MLHQDVVCGLPPNLLTNHIPCLRLAMLLLPTSLLFSAGSRLHHRCQGFVKRVLQGRQHV